MFKDKRGQGLSLNIVVIAIIAVIILVIIAFIFAGGIGKVWSRMGSYLETGTAGKSLEFIGQQCNFACSTARMMDDPSESTYCKQEFKYDKTGAGKEIQILHCYDSRVNAHCAGVTEAECK